MNRVFPIAVDGLAGVPPGFLLHSRYFGEEEQLAVLQSVRSIIAAAPLYTPAMPKSGRPFSVRMTNAGPLGWVSDKSGYRYQRFHPETGKEWPEIPDVLLALWRDVAPGQPPPEACLVNYYAPGTRLGSHVDADEKAMDVPVVSVSLGDEAVFHVGGARRGDKKVRMPLRSGDVVVLGGEARRAYHGIDRVRGGTSPLLAEGGRFNLTLRRVTACEE